MITAPTAPRAINVGVQSIGNMVVFGVKVLEIFLVFVVDLLKGLDCLGGFNVSLLVCFEQASDLDQ